MHNHELLAIVEAFKTWRHYLESYKYGVLVLTDHNDLCQFMNTKSLSFFQVCWAQELSQYHFQIDYCQRKANTAVDAVFRFSQRSQAKEKTLRDENTQIFHHLQTSLIKASLSRLSLSSHETVLTMLHQLFILGRTFSLGYAYF